MTSPSAAAPADAPATDALTDPGSTSTPVTAPRLTASMLFYAFADALAPKAGRLDKAKAVPCAGPDVKVQQDALAAILVHAAFWDLGRRGVIRFEDVERKVLFRKVRSLKVRVADGAEIGAEVADSLEFDVLQSALKLRGDGDVRAVVRGLYAGDAEDPYRRAIAMANVAEIAAGFVRLDVEERHGLGKLRGRKETLVWQCDVVASHTADFNATVHDWATDRDADRPAFDRLRTEIDRAIASRKERDRESLLETMADD